MQLHLYKNITEMLSWSRSQITSFARNAPNKYKVYTIPKRSSGQRLIAHPSRKLKLLQRALVEILSNNLIPHECAFAYRNSISIKENAQYHLDNQYLLKMDFSDFFNSITPDILFSVCEIKEITLSEAEKWLLQRAFFWNKTKSHDGKLVLSVGAPSSPLISNFIMYPFDEAINLYCTQHSIYYTRYADDLTFSTKIKNTLFNIPDIVKWALKKHYASQISINEFKTVFSSKAHNRHITGITITNDNKLSVGRERKRMISSLIHKYKIGIVNEEEKTYLQGLLSFSFHIEPMFKIRMSKKYSPEIINEILKFRK
ncbi:RNA-directed DNA polymerase [Photorhabdus khanii]|uniref:RNA-directed DNA polymerase n=1 Tax=Photorhabdus khanii TaxID=1004150 RepID=A0A7C9GKK6_9GAMM|nr:retron St85 family RNA-directed DNA polymerase [Photorhabdus khanii]MQL49114.1 RNA-directed DNA polymerase [Photorhabdus khanii]